ncbi:MAG: ABC-2 transporter permease [Eubacteriales bacterium]|nr:ABC-2 transporter permease [Eubacteriales bacterium]
MKGLFVKDLLILKNQKRNFLILPAIIIMYSFMGMGGVIMEFMGLIMLMYANGTIAYDEFDNGAAFLFTMPFTRKQYVLEKYLFTIAAGITGIIAGVIAVLISGIFTVKIPFDEIAVNSAAAVLLCAMTNSVMLPVTLKYGSEKSRTVMMVVFGGLTAAGVLILKMFPEIAEGSITEFPDTLNLPLLIIACAAPSAVMLCISCAVSAGIMEKKEF